VTRRRRRSLLEDDEVVILGRDESSGGDVCERCGHARERHGDSGCEGSKSCSCEEFKEEYSRR
jgi:hypothetical protein